MATKWTFILLWVADAPCKRTLSMNSSSQENALLLMLVDRIWNLAGSSIQELYIIQKVIKKVAIRGYSIISRTLCITLIGFKKILFDSGLDLHKQDYTRFWLNKYKKLVFYAFLVTADFQSRKKGFFRAIFQDLFLIIFVRAF